MRPYRTLVAIAALAVLCSAPARAQVGSLRARSGGGGSRALTFGIGGGLSVPVSDASDALKSGFNGIAYARFQPAGLPVGFGVNVSFHRFDMKDAVVNAAGPGVTGGSGSLLAGLADVKLDLMRGPVRPYVLLGLGAYDVTTKLDGSAGGSRSDTRFGVNGGAGVSARLGSIRGFVQGRLDNVFTEQGVLDTKSIQVVPVSLGLEF